MAWHAQSAPFCRMCIGRVVAVVQKGDTTCGVMVELEPSDLNLLPGMNAEVEILTD